jgi:hypothetical protein
LNFIFLKIEKVVLPHFGVGKNFVTLVDDQKLDFIQLESFAGNKIQDSSWGAYNDMGSFWGLESFVIILYINTTDELLHLEKIKVLA